MYVLKVIPLKTHTTTFNDFSTMHIAATIVNASVNIRVGALGKALAKEPKNKQIKEALLLAERGAAKQVTEANRSR